jgi:hypothetical protein
MVWKTQLKHMMRNSKAKSVLAFWAKTGVVRGSLRSKGKMARVVRSF